jgi:CRP-like cAMP-binding protein/glyoxylase-like metal-dependent hydrolase (beta-lactamase superfamily II)
MSSDDALRELPRGGWVVETSAGPIQFGAPPETIKDHMAEGAAPPTIYVIPRVRFDLQRGVNVCEIEFPAYYNFFVKQRRIRVICDADEEARLRRVLTETLFGPQALEADELYHPSFPVAARANHAVECRQFKANPFKPDERMSVDTLVEFVRYDEDGVARLGAVELRRAGEPEAFVVADGGRELARVPARVRLPELEPPSPSAEALTPFDPPAFGVTVLGASHGFDPKGKTTGFILWINRRGLLVDPPMGSTELLAASGIAPKMIDGVILTHCHADHDSGTFQKVLEEGRVVIYTSVGIMGSFLRKYSALSGLDEDFLRRTFVFRPVRIGAPLPVHGGELRFFHALHSIPTIGFEAYYGGKSLAFSADTLYDPEQIEAMVAAGTITRERADVVLGFPWHHSVVLHEAGVPPLHTPVRVLAELPDDVKARLYLVHIAGADLPEGVGLKVAPVGVENTLRIEVDPPRRAESIELLDVFAGIDLFRGFSLARAREILQVAKVLPVPRGEQIIAEGTAGDAFYIIRTGVASVRTGGVEIKRYQAGDFFGETALIRFAPRNADVFAHSDLELVRIDRYDFLYLLRGTDIPRRLLRLAQMREERSWELFARNSALGTLTSAQKTQLQSYLDVQPTRAGEVLWPKGRAAEHAYLVDTGSVSLEGYCDGLEPFSTGAFLGEVDALVAGSATTGSARVVEAGRVFRIGRSDLASWFDENPGAYLSFMGTRAIE